MCQGPGPLTHRIARERTRKGTDMDKIIIEPITSMKNAFSVAGQNVVITGGNRGLGRGIAQAFAECGANVAIL